eukprot:g27816.t1
MKAWNSEKGFGFCALDGMAADIFVHIADCIGTQPQVGDVISFETEPSHKKDGTTNFKAKNVTGGSAPLKRDFGLGKKDDEPAAAAAPALDLASLGLQGGALGVPGLSLGIPGLAGLVPGLGLGGMSLPGLSAEHLAALAQPQMIPGLTPGLVSAAPGMAGFPTMPLVGAGLPAMGYVDPGDWIATGQLGVPDVVILDHRGARYHEDLLALEPMREHARIIADNVLSPGASESRERFCRFRFRGPGDQGLCS